MDPDWKRRFGELRAVLGGSYRFAGQFTTANLEDPKPSSAAARDLSVDDGYPNAEDAQARALLYLHVAEDALLSLDCLLVEEAPQYGYMPLARACLEASGRAWWILEPGLAHRERCRRGVVERLTNLLEERNAFRAAGETEAAAAKDELIVRIVQQAADAGIAVKLDDLPTRVTVDAQRRPSSRKIIQDLLTGAGAEEIAGVTFPYLSGASKGMYFAIAQGFKLEQHPAGHVIGRPKLSIEDVETPVAVSLLGWGEAFSRAVTYFGWDAEMWLRWKTHIGTTVLLKRRRAASP